MWCIQDGAAETQSPATTAASCDDDARRKKARTTFTGRQIFELERQFEQKKYLSSVERAEMASLLNVTETQVRPRMCHRRLKRLQMRLGDVVVRASDL